MWSQCLYRLWQSVLAGESQICCRTGRSYIEIFVKKFRVLFGELIDTNEEYSLEFQTFDVLYVDTTVRLT